MLKARLLLVFCIVIGTDVVESAESKLLKVWYGGGRFVVGPMTKSDADSVTVLDLKTFQDRIIPKRDILKTDELPGDDLAVAAVGMPAVVAYRIGERAEGANRSGQALGKIAQVTPTAVYVSIGKDRGIATGQKLNVFRPGAEIKDPDTGKVLARERPKVAELDVFEVADTVCKGRIVGGLEITLLTGDEVEAIVPRFMVAVLPITDEVGSESVGGSALREQLLTALVKRNIPVVERSRLDAVVEEAALQNVGALFDPAQAQKFGQLLGAGMAVTGKLTATNDVIEAHMRLVNVATGEVLLAISGKLLEGADAPGIGGRVMSVTKLQELMKDARGDDYSIRRKAIDELGATKSPAAAKFLAEEMLMRDSFRTSDALESMGPVAADALMNVVKTGDFSERIRAMRVFAKVAQKKHIPFLQTLKNDFHLKSEAGRAIERLQSE